LVMGDDVVASALEMLVDPRIEPVVRRLAEISLFQEFDEDRGGLLDEEQRGRLQGFIESLRKPHSETVLVPVLGHAPDPHFQVPCRRVRIEQTEVLPQLGLSLIRSAELSTVNITIAE